MNKICIENNMNLNRFEEMLLDDIDIIKNTPKQLKGML